MKFEAEFERLAAEWAAYQKRTFVLSDPAAPLRCPAYEALCKLGPKAVPLVMQRYDSVESGPWGAVLSRLTGKTGFGDGTQGDVVATFSQWRHWWVQEGQKQTWG